MSVNIYVNSLTGDDIYGLGTSLSPYRTINRAVADLAQPVVEWTNILLAGTLAAPQEYDAARFEGVQVLGKEKVNLRPAIWNDDNYERACDPFAADDLGSLNVEGAKPCYISGEKSMALQFYNTRGVIVSGVGVLGPQKSGSLMFPGVLITDDSRVDLRYCQVSSFTVGLIASNRSVAHFENGVLSDNTVGAMTYRESTLEFEGENYILECGAKGIVATGSSKVFVQAWMRKPRSYYTTEISTEGLRDNYQALLLKEASLLQIVDLTDIMGAGSPILGQIKILKKNLNAASDYVGLVLEGRSTALNTKNIIFNDLEFNEGKPTLSAGQQMKAAESEACVTVE